jgi:hypothetical protein
MPDLPLNLRALCVSAPMEFINGNPEQFLVGNHFDHAL